MLELVLNHSLHDHYEAGIKSGCQTHYGAIYEKPKLKTHELYHIYGTTLGEIRRHNRSRTQWFQVQSVTCWESLGFSLRVWSIFHIFLSKGFGNSQEVLNFNPLFLKL
jgi:hypothetical protein